MISRNLSLLAVSCLLLTSLQLQAETTAKVIRSTNMPAYPVGTEIKENTRIQTQRGQRVAIKTGDGDIISISEQSSFKVEKANFFEQLFGKVFYFFNPRMNNPVKIKSSVATMGIRGTKFIITDAGDRVNAEIALAEGLLNIESNDDQPFTVSSKRELTEFEKYKLESLQEMQQTQDEFEAYKKQLEQEFIEYKMSFELQENNTLTFDGKSVSQAPIADDQFMEFAEFEAFLAEELPR